MIIKMIKKISNCFNLIDNKIPIQLDSKLTNKELLFIYKLILISMRGEEEEQKEINLYNKILSKLEAGDEAIEKLKIAKKNFAIIERIINDENKILSKIAAEEIAQEKLNQIDNMINDFCPDCREVRCIIRSDER